MKQVSLLNGLTERNAWQPAAPPDLSHYDTVQLDAETTGLEWHKTDRPVGWAVRAGGRSYYLPVAHRGGGNLSEETVREWMRRELRGKRISGLNLRFDLHMARVFGADLTAQGNTFRDVAHSAALLDDHRRGFSLDALAQDYLGIGKLEVGPKDQMQEMPAWQVEPYACRDVELVELLEQAFAPKLAAESLDKVQALEDRVIPAVVDMEANGCPLNEALLAEWLEDSERRLDELLWSISRVVGFQINPDSSDHLARVFKAVGEPIVAFTAKGAPSFTAVVMKDAATRHAVIQQIYTASKLIDLRNKFLKPYAEVLYNGKLWPSFYQLMTGEGGTVSGRFSAARPNVQQVLGKDKHKRDYGDLPYLIRALFVPEGGLWFCADQAQVEYRLAAHFTGSERLISRYRENPRTDYHALVGEMLTPHRPSITRTEIKTCNFLKIYGGGPKKLAAQLGVDVEIGYELSDQYDAAFPEMKALLDRAARVAETRGYVKTIYGRRCRFPYIARDKMNSMQIRDRIAGCAALSDAELSILLSGAKRERTYKALNAVIQGSAADVFKQTLADVYENRKTLGITLRAVVHDEIDGDVESQEHATRIEEFLNEQRVQLNVPILWEASTGANWADAK